MLRSFWLASLLSLSLSSGAARCLADLVLVVGEGPPTLATNRYGFDGTYHDHYGRGGTSENVAHPGGGPVALLYVLNADLSVSTYFDAKAGPYDGADDTQVGVLNLSSRRLNSLTLGGGNVSNIFAFDGDGLDAAPYHSPGNALDTSGYGGPLTYFTNINPPETKGVANFIGGLAPDGGSTYFGLENPPVMGGAPPAGPPGTGPGPIPEPSSLVLASVGGVGLLGYRWRRRRLRGA